MTILKTCEKPRSSCIYKLHKPLLPHSPQNNVQILVWQLTHQSLSPPLYSQAAAASVAEPLEGVVQRAPCRHPPETAGECPADPPEPGWQPGARLAPRVGGHRSHPQWSRVRAPTKTELYSHYMDEIVCFSGKLLIFYSCCNHSGNKSKLRKLNSTKTSFFLLLQRVIDQNSLSVPAVGGDRLFAHHALHVPPDSGGCSRQLWPAEPGAQHQPHLHRLTGEIMSCGFIKKKCA